MNDTHTVSNRVPPPAVVHWHAGFNVPCYLPESEPAVYATFAAARHGLAWDMATHADDQESWADDHDCDDIPCPAHGDDCPSQNAGAIRAERDDLLASQGPEWSGNCGGLSYWIMLCGQSDCVDNLVADIAAAVAEHAGSPLDILAATGAIHAATASEAERHRHLVLTEDDPGIDLLCRYIAAIGPRASVPGWPTP